MTINDLYIRTIDDLETAVTELGILPFFMNSIRGFSIDEHVDPGIWFTGNDGPWEWKGPVINELGCAYGKFFEKKAAYISPEWFLHFANYRRDGYDYEGMVEDELVSYRDKQLYDLVTEAGGPILSKELKALGNYRKGGNKGFDTIITRLQMQSFVIVNDFKYMTDKYGREYGWGVAEYTTPEWFFGEYFYEKTYCREPGESYERILEHLGKLLPTAGEADLKKLLG
jgi:hypothetical protein